MSLYRSFPLAGYPSRSPAEGISRSRTPLGIRDRTKPVREYSPNVKERDNIFYDEREGNYYVYDRDDDRDYRERDYYDTDRDDTSDSSRSSFVRVRRRLTRAERYSRPNNVTEVDLQNISGVSTFHARAPEREATGHRLDRLTLIRQRHHFESIEWRKILSIRRYVNQDGRETALVQAQMSTAGGGKDDFEFEWM